MDGFVQSQAHPMGRTYRSSAVPGRSHQRRVSAGPSAVTRLLARFVTEGIMPTIMTLAEALDRLTETEQREALALLARTVPVEVARAVQTALAHGAPDRLARATIVPGEVIESVYHPAPGRASGGAP